VRIDFSDDLLRLVTEEAFGAAFQLVIMPQVFADDGIVEIR